MAGVLVIALLATLALAAPLPPEPTEQPPVAGDCPSATPLPGTVDCVAVAVPPAKLGRLLAVETWGEAVRDRYEVDVPACEAAAKASADEAAALRAQLARPVPFLRRPGTVATASVVGTLAVVFLGAEVVSAAGGR